jgi:hypothetical protein
MYKILLLSLLILGGCAHTTPDFVKPEIVVAKRVQYVLRIPPAELMTLPTVQEKIDVDTAKQSDIALWIVANEDRVRLIENQLIGIAQFFTVEDAKLKDQALEENKASVSEALKKQADIANQTIKKEVIK